MTMPIRLVRATDADEIVAIYAPIVASTAISFEVVAPDASQIVNRIAEIQPRYPWLVYESDGRVAGYAYATRHRERQAYRWSVDTSAYVHPDYRRRGVGGALYKSLMAILSAQRFFNAYAGIALPNPASVRLHESAGFQPIGVYRAVGYKLGAWHDVGWWGLSLRPREDVPAEPIDILTVQRLPEWHSLVSAGISSTGPG